MKTVSLCEGGFTGLTPRYHRFPWYCCGKKMKSHPINIFLKFASGQTIPRSLWNTKKTAIQFSLLPLYQYQIALTPTPNPQESTTKYIDVLSFYMCAPWYILKKLREGLENTTNRDGPLRGGPEIRNFVKTKKCLLRGVPPLSVKKNSFFVKGVVFGKKKMFNKRHRW